MCGWRSALGVWMSWFLGRRTQEPITTVGRRQIGTPARAVRGSELVAMVDPGVERTKVSTAEQHRVTPRPARRGSHAGHHGVESQLPPDEPWVCGRHR